MDKIMTYEKDQEAQEVARRLDSGKYRLIYTDYELYDRKLAKKLLLTNLHWGLHDADPAEAERYAGNLAKFNGYDQNYKYFYNTLSDDTIRPVPLSLVRMKH